MPVKLDFDIPLEDFETPEDEDLGIKDESNGSITYAFIGSGQGGCRLAEAFFDLGYTKTICVNTAQHDLNGLNSIPENQKLHMDTGTVDGAGKDMEKGENASVKYQQEIYDKMKSVFGSSVDRILVCAGLGGGTGGGSVLVLLDLARKYLNYLRCENPAQHVGAIVTLPTTGEAMSPIVAENAKTQATRLAEYASQGEISPLIFVDNDKIQKLYPKLTVKQFWPIVNATVAGLFHTFNAISTQSSEYTTFDPADYSSIMSMGGCMIMGLTNIRNYQSETDISRALKDNLNKTLLAEGFDLTTAKGAAVITIGGTSLFEEVPGLMSAIEYGFDTIANLTGNSTVHRGIYEIEKDKLTVYTLIGGLNSPDARIARLGKSSGKQLR
jgi:cell division GTPase FtsZ